MVDHKRFEPLNEPPTICIVYDVIENVNMESENVKKL